MSDLDEAGARETAQAIVATVGKAIGVAANVRNPASPWDAAAAVEAALGEIDIVLNNAGLPQFGQ